jgi:spore coat protein Z
MCIEEKNKNCVCEVVKLILHIQKNRKEKERIIDSCDKPFLGDEPCEEKENTRPFILYTPEGNLWKAFFEDKGCVGKSWVFRVEKLEDCCATLRVLKPCREPLSPDTIFDCDTKWIATNSFITIDLSCVCGIQCLKDTFVDCL